MDINISTSEEKIISIPEYYKPVRQASIDYLTIILDDIRNYRKLNKLKISYISKLSPENKQTIIETYNECMTMVEDILTANS